MNKNKNKLIIWIKKNETFSVLPIGYKFITYCNLNSVVGNGRRSITAIQKWADAGSIQTVFDSKLEWLQAEIARLRERNVELLAQAEKKSQSGEQQLQAQQAHMQMRLIQQAQVETEKFGKAVEQMVHLIICTEKVIYKFLHYKLSSS